MIAVILVNWNSSLHTIQCLEALLRIDVEDGEKVEIYIVDNDSSASDYAVLLNYITSLLLPEQIREILLIRTEKNLGFGGGNNIGIRRALERGAEYIWLLNNDTLPDKMALRALVEFLDKNPEVGAVGSQLIYPDGRGVQALGGGIVNLLFGTSEHIVEQHKLAQLNYLTAASMMIRSEVLKQIGGFSEKIFLYWEDVELSLRIKKAGWNLGVALDSVIVHHESVSSSKLGPKRQLYFTQGLDVLLRQQSGLPNLYIYFIHFVRMARKLLMGNTEEARVIYGYILAKANKNAGSKSVVYDDKWLGEHGIGRFAKEIFERIAGKLLSSSSRSNGFAANLLATEIFNLKYIFRKENLFLSPGYTPPIFWRGPFIFTLHDLIHLDFPEERSTFKNLYYKYIVKAAVFRAQRVLTVSEFSRQRILEWSGAPPEQVVVVGNGVDVNFSPDGPVHQPGYPYIFYVRNTKPHKNVSRLLEAFAQMDAPELRLVLSGKADDETRHLALRLGVYDRVVFAGRIPEEDLPAYYRGAAVVTMPSLYEGFGLPALEGMACGVPVVVSNTTSLPEVVGDAGILVDPNDVQSIAAGLTLALTDEPLRAELRRLGLERAKLFNWDDVAAKVRHELDIAGAK